jgi:hypothetical protein
MTDPRVRWAADGVSGATIPRPQRGGTRRPDGPVTSHVGPSPLSGGHGTTHPRTARQIHDRLGPAVGYLWRLNDRALATGLSVRARRLGGLIRTARDAMHALSVELHYQRCEHGVGREPSEPAPGGPTGAELKPGT